MCTVFRSRYILEDETELIGVIIMPHAPQRFATNCCVPILTVRTYCIVHDEPYVRMYAQSSYSPINYYS